MSSPSCGLGDELTTCRKLGTRLNVVGIIDLDIPRAQGIIDGKRAANIKGYEATKVFTSVKEAGVVLQGELSPQ